MQSRWGQADVLVNNAGISFIAPAESVGGKAFLRVLEVNLLAPFLLAKAFGTMMLARRSGCIVNVASIAGLVGIADRAAYNSLEAWTDRSEAYAGRGVGWPRGPRECRVSGLGKDRDGCCRPGGGGYNDADIEGMNPMGRFASPDDIARAIRFLRVQSRADL